MQIRSNNNTKNNHVDNENSLTEHIISHDETSSIIGKTAVLAVKNTRKPTRNPVIKSETNYSSLRIIPKPSTKLLQKSLPPRNLTKSVMAMTRTARISAG